MRTYSLYPRNVDVSHALSILISSKNYEDKNIMIVTHGYEDHKVSCLDDGIITPDLFIHYDDESLEDNMRNMKSDDLLIIDSCRTMYGLDLSSIINDIVCDVIILTSWYDIDSLVHAVEILTRIPGINYLDIGDDTPISINSWSTPSGRSINVRDTPIRGDGVTYNHKEFITGKKIVLVTDVGPEHQYENVDALYVESGTYDLVVAYIHAIVCTKSLKIFFGDKMDNVRDRIVRSNDIFSTLKSRVVSTRYDSSTRALS